MLGSVPISLRARLSGAATEDPRSIDGLVVAQPMRVAVYTAITAGKDSLKEPPVHDDVDYVLFTDQPQDHEGSRWEVRSACDLFKDPRRNSRAHKLLAHQYLPEHDYSLWIDGSLRLLAAARKLVDAHLRDADVAMFRHPARSCLYVEAAGCADAGADHRHIIEEQIAKYRRAGYPSDNGLNECAVILRRHNQATAAFNETWWAEYCRHSCRDQVSVNYALSKSSVRLALLPGSVYDNPGIVYYEDHLRR